MSDWPFPDPPDTAVLAVRDVVFSGEWIAYVSHDADDGTWQFHASSPETPRVEDAVVVGLGEMVRRDPRLVELADLPEGWYAWRESINGRWNRAPNR